MGIKKASLYSLFDYVAEFVALVSACKEVEWLRNLLYEIPLWPKPMLPLSIRYDSASVLARAYNNVYNSNSRHIGLRHSYQRQLIKDGVIIVDFIRPAQNLADPLTKGLAI